MQLMRMKSKIEQPPERFCTTTNIMLGLTPHPGGGK
jgi:hypothetical protein